MTESKDSKRPESDQDPDANHDASSADLEHAARAPAADEEPTASESAVGQDDAESNEIASDAANADDAPSGGKRSGPASSGPPARRGGRGLAWFALLLALAALALASMPFWMPPDESRSTADELRLDEFQVEIDELRQRLSEAEKPDPELAELRQRLTEAEQADPAVAELRQRLSSRMDSLEANIETLRDAGDEPDPALQRLEGRIERIAGDTNATVEALRARIADAEGNIESRLARFEQGLDGLEGDVRQTAARLSERLWLLRIEALLSAGADRMLLFGDVAGAERAWDVALSQTESLDGSRYQQLRERLAEDLTQLRSMGRQADPADRASALLAAAGTVSNWPLAADAAARSGGSDSASDDDPDQDGWRQRLGGFMDRLIVVERTDDEFLDPSERDRARERTEALLEALALMLLQGEHQRAEVLAAELERHVRAVFVAEHPAVAGVLDDLDLSAFGEAPALDPEPVLRETRRLAEGLR